MASIKCGHCEQHHTSVQEVRECYSAETIVAGIRRDPMLEPTYATGGPGQIKAASVEPVEITDGYWQSGQDIYKVQRSQSSGHLYAKILTEDGWDYAPGAMNALRNGGNAVQLTEEAAATYGKLYGRCALCGRTLTNEASIERGIGPVCAERQGW